MPDFIIIGAQKSGTSSLFYYLSQHPQLLHSTPKEVHYFDSGLNPNVDSYEKGESWYRAHFPLKREATGPGIAFEATPSYIAHPLAAKRIFDLVPNVKIVALLRNPTDRAISHYFHNKRRGKEPLPIAQAFREEESRLKSLLQHNDYQSENFLRYSYKYRGIYWNQLLRYREYFSREQTLILCSEEFFREPLAVLGRVVDFVGADSRFQVKDLKPRGVSRNKTEINQEVYEYLNEYFAPHNQSLYELVGEDYGW